MRPLGEEPAHAGPDLRPGACAPPWVGGGSSMQDAFSVRLGRKDRCVRGTGAPSSHMNGENPAIDVGVFSPIPAAAPVNDAGFSRLACPTRDGDARQFSPLL